MWCYILSATHTSTLLSMKSWYETLQEVYWFWWSITVLYYSACIFQISKIPLFLMFLTKRSLFFSICHQKTPSCIKFKSVTKRPTFQVSETSPPPPPSAPIKIIKGICTHNVDLITTCYFNLYKVLSTKWNDCCYKMQTGQ